MFENHKIHKDNDLNTAWFCFCFLRDLTVMVREIKAKRNKWDYMQENNFLYNVK